MLLCTRLVVVAALAAPLNAQDLLISRLGPNQVSSRPLPGSLTPSFDFGAINPISTRVGPDGMLYVVERGTSNTVKRYYPGGALDTTWSPPTGLTSPSDVAFDSTNGVTTQGIMYVADFGANQIVPYNLNTGIAGAPIAATTPAFLLYRNGLLFVSEFALDQVRKCNPPAALTPFITSATGGLDGPEQIAFQSNQYYVASALGNKVLRYGNSGGVPLGTTAPALGNSEGLNLPIGVAVGPGGSIYVTSTNTNQVLEYDALGYVGVFANTTGPDGLTVYEEPTAPFPVRAGELVATYCPSMGAGNVPDPLGHCVVLVDERFGGPTGENWPAPFFSNEDGPPSEIWNYQNLGSVFGVCVDNDPAPNIYVTSTTAYGDFGASTFGPGGGGGVYKLDGCSGEIRPWMVTGSAVIGDNQLPNSGAGLGDICYDKKHDQFFVSNFRDGKIYRVKDVGNEGILQSAAYDPFAAFPYPFDPDFAPPGERVWALHVSRFYATGSPEGELLFSVWLRDTGRPTTPWPAAWGPSPGAALENNTIWSWPMDSTGALIGAPQLWRIMPHLVDKNGNDLGYSNPVSDITSDFKKVFTAERTFFFGNYGAINDGASAHQSRILMTSFVPKGSAGSAFDYRYRIGDGQAPIDPSFGLGWNSSGGVAVERARVWGTGDALHYAVEDYLYGLQGIPALGNAQILPPNQSVTSKLIDLDHDISGADKSQSGDVEYIPKSGLCDGGG